MKILLIDSNYPINTRNTKILNSLKRKNSNFEIGICAWNRENLYKEDSMECDRVYLYNMKSKLGNWHLKLFHMWGYYKYLKKVNKKLNPDILIASHYDMLFLVSWFKNKNQVLVYENLDIPSSNNKIMLYILQRIEKNALKKVDIITFASRFYLPLYNFYKGWKVQLENHPSLSFDFSTPSLPHFGDTINISFIGGVRYVEILKKLILSSVDYDNIQIFIHGYGHQYDHLKEFIKDGNFEKKVVLTGRYDYNDIPRLYNNSDFIWAVYPNDNYNVKYAISNKFHESILFSKPGIYSKKTKLGNLVEENQIGLTVNPLNIDDIKKLLHSISTRKIDLYKLINNLNHYKSISNSWEDEFDLFNNILLKKIRP